jgi:hypothetical protein
MMNVVVVVALFLLTTLTLVASHANANVESALVKSLQNDTYLFAVTISHEDELDAEHYCDGWSVYSDDHKETLYTSPGGSRDGLTVHFDAPNTPQPSQGVVYIPSNVEAIVVRAHDKQHGFGGTELFVNMDVIRVAGEYKSVLTRPSRINPLKKKR